MKMVLKKTRSFYCTTGLRKLSKVCSIGFILSTILIYSGNILVFGSGSNQIDKNKPVFSKESPYYFDGSISRQTLENYLDRSVTMGYFLVPGTPEGYQLPYKHDDIRMIKNMGAKFIGRAIYRWSEESRLGDPEFLVYAKAMIDTVHAFDPEIIFQGCLFESVSNDVNNLKIPS